MGFLIYIDEGQAGMGDCLYALSTQDGENVERALCLANGLLSKRIVVAHEVLATVLGIEDLYRILQPLLFDHAETALKIFVKSDSLCGLAMLNNIIAIKSTLLENGIQSFIETLNKITLEFKNSQVMVGYYQGKRNSTDMMTKLFRDPCAIINSSLYRFGDENMGKVSNLEMDTVARASKGVF